MQQAKDALTGWEKQLEDLKRLLPVELALTKLTKEDILAAEQEAERTNARLMPATNKAEEVGGAGAADVDPRLTSLSTSAERRSPH